MNSGTSSIGGLVWGFQPVPLKPNREGAGIQAIKPNHRLVASCKVKKLRLPIPFGKSTTGCKSLSNDGTWAQPGDLPSAVLTLQAVFKKGHFRVPAVNGQNPAPVKAFGFLPRLISDFGITKPRSVAF